MPTYAYPEDTTGTLPSNLIQNEPQILTPDNSLTYRTLVPTFAPFYLNNLSVRAVVGNSSVILQKDVDYTVCLPYLAASDMVGQLIYGGINILNQNLQGTVYITYRTLGGKWVADPTWIAERMAEEILNARTISWDQITNVQEIFPPVDHHQHYNDLTGHQELITAVNGVSQEILNAAQNPNPSLLAHLVDPDAHKLTLSKENFGLEKVSNIATAFDQDVLDIANGNNSIEPKLITVQQAVMLFNHLLALRGL